jgi:beta-phosphoglucomutase-like phosphatase (HAD superfamily)
MQAGHAAGVSPIGYANRPGKHEQLSEAGAELVVSQMDQIANLL